MTSYRLAALATVSSANAALSLLETMAEVTDESTKPSRQRRVARSRRAAAAQTPEPEAESWKF
jgi:hypothetical protein